MPRFTSQEMEQHQIGDSQFTFQGARIERLGATQYTLVTIAIDTTSSIADFAKELKDALIAAVEACKRSPRSDNLLLRVITFSSWDGIKELHGFKELREINVGDYPDFQPNGMTPLYDAVFSAFGAMVSYGERLMENDYLTNAIGFIITDGIENASREARVEDIRKVLESAGKDEKLESLVSVLVGVNAFEASDELQAFQRDAHIDEYVDVTDASAGKLAKLAQFVSRSVMSQSQAIGTGGPSQKIQATI